MFFDGKMQDALDLTRQKSGKDPITRPNQREEELAEQEFEKGDYLALVLAAFKTFWPIFLVLALIIFLLL